GWPRQLVLIEAIAFASPPVLGYAGGERVWDGFG
ncbi:hypothetical protein LCGC14_1977780, partial [marine sediment metagenome]